MATLRDVHEELKRLDFESYREAQHVFLGVAQLRKLRSLLNQIETGARNNALADFGRILSDGVPNSSRLWRLVGDCPELEPPKPAGVGGSPPLDATKEAGPGDRPMVETVHLPRDQDVLVGAPASPPAVDDMRRIQELLKSREFVREAYLPQIYFPGEERAELAVVLLVAAGAEPQPLLEELLRLLDELPSLQEHSVCLIVKEDVDGLIESVREHPCRLL